MIFVSDMGDSLSRKSDFPFLKSDVIEPIQSKHGKHHLWLWLTKRPELMAEFAREIGGLPENVCAMTTVTSPAGLERIDQLREVDAQSRGLSLEPLWERIPPEKLNLKGIDWVIVHRDIDTEVRDYCFQAPISLNMSPLPSLEDKLPSMRASWGPPTFEDERILAWRVTP